MSFENPPIVRISKQQAAQGQLDSAIYLWFADGDMASIHTLAVAAQTLVHHVGSKVGKPSQAEEWVKAQSKAFQKRVRSAQNFFKHANSDPDRVLGYAPQLAEIYLIDAISCFRAIYATVTPLMLTFCVRFSVEHPNVLTPQDCPVKFPEGVDITDLAKLGRQEFFDFVLPVASERLRKRGFHLP